MTNKVQPYCSDLRELLGSSSKSLRMMQDSGPRLLNCKLRTTERHTHKIENTCQTCTGHIELTKIHFKF